MTDEPFDEQPWNEEQWERFLHRSDVRSAKFGELLETLMDHPDRDEIIAREMGWDRGDQDDDQDDESEIELPDIQDVGTDEELEEFERRREESLNAIPAYVRGFEWGTKVHKALEKYLKGSEEPDPDDPLVVAFSDSLVVTAKIAGGHGMGYDEEVLCGNIVCCKRSLEAADRSVAALEELAQRGTVPAETIQPLLEEGKLIRDLVQQHIAHLRSRVWWQ